MLKFYIVDNKVEEVNLNKSEVNIKNLVKFSKILENDVNLDVFLFWVFVL